jgi:hypothetical protein
LIPRAKIPLGYELMSDVSTIYHRLGRVDRFNELAGELETVTRKLIDDGQGNLQSYYNPYRVLLDVYETKGEYQKAIDLLKGLQVQFPNDPGLTQRIEMLKVQAAAQQVTQPDSVR